MAAGHWLSKDVVAVVIVDDDQVVVAATGWNGKFASLIGRDLTGDGLYSVVTEMRPLVGVVGVREGIVIHEDVCVGFAWYRSRGRYGSWSCLQLGRLDVLAYVSLVALDGGGLKRWVVAESARSQTGKTVNVAFVEGFLEGRKNRVAECSVHEGDNVCWLGRGR